MASLTFKKVLTANDTGESGGHQAGIHIPKGDTGLLAFLPRLDSGVKNPDAWIQCVDQAGEIWKFRYIHYNNKLHDLNGTRNEYRITNMTKYFRSVGAREGDDFLISSSTAGSTYNISLIPVNRENSWIKEPIKLKGWSRVH
jgi:hypothetical protein